jgi:hypothetical protein
MTDSVRQRRPIVSEEAVAAMLGMQAAVPVSSETMARSLTVTFYPVYEASSRLRRFADRLQAALRACGACVLEYADVLIDPGKGRLREDIVVIITGDQEMGNLVVDHITNLRKTTMVALLDGPCPAEVRAGSQEKLNSLVQALCWHLAQIVLYIDDDAWTITTMNGAIIKCGMDTLQKDVFDFFVPKIAAPVVPPHASDFDIREGALDLRGEQYRSYVEDFRQSGPLWERTGLMLFHTSLDSLDFRNRYYKRIAAAFLDHRSGMSYGFLARQVACQFDETVALSTIAPDGPLSSLHTTGVCRREEALYVVLDSGPVPLVARVPPVWTLTTRSGCDKAHIDAARDLVLMGLVDGKVVFATPQGVNHGIDCKPSYDTLTILSHALGNAFVGILESARNPASQFSASLRQSGLALAHWHGAIDPGLLPPGYILHGVGNPPVSCSTFQAAIYALVGKLGAYAAYRSRGEEFAGEAHIEPHHGVNITGPSLVWLAEWALERREALVAAMGEELTMEGREPGTDI